MKKHFLSGLLAACLLLSLASPALAAPQIFSDVPANAWYAQDVNEVQAYGIIEGRGNGRFDPNGTITLAEVLTLAAKTMAYYEEETFVPGGSVWYENAVRYLQGKGISLFPLENAVYREECSRGNMAYYFSLVAPAGHYAKLNSIDAIPDVKASDGAWAVATIKLYEAGILTGSDQYGTFHPYNSITRAEAAVILNRVLAPENRKQFTLAVSNRAALQAYFNANYSASNAQYLIQDMDGDGIEDMIVAWREASGGYTSNLKTDFVDGATVERTYGLYQDPATKYLVETFGGATEMLRVVVSGRYICMQILNVSEVGASGLYAMIAVQNKEMVVVQLIENPGSSAGEALYSYAGEAERLLYSEEYGVGKTGGSYSSYEAALSGELKQYGFWIDGDNQVCGNQMLLDYQKGYW